MTLPPQAAKELVRDFLETVFVRHDIDDGFARCIGPTYRQHNPGVPDGVEGFKRHFQAYFASFPHAGLEIHRLFCDGDHVTAHLRWYSGAEDHGSAVMDIFRIEHGRIVEHWDVMQSIPASMAHANGMF